MYMYKKIICPIVIGANREKYNRIRNREWGRGAQKGPSSSYRS